MTTKAGFSVTKAHKIFGLNAYCKQFLDIKGFTKSNLPINHSTMHICYYYQWYSQVISWRGENCVHVNNEFTHNYRLKKLLITITQ